MEVWRYGGMEVKPTSSFLTPPVLSFVAGKCHGFKIIYTKLRNQIPRFASVGVSECRCIGEEIEPYRSIGVSVYRRKTLAVVTTIFIDTPLRRY
jgi:hypothetical protein